MVTVPKYFVSVRGKERLPGHGLILGLFIGKCLYFCQNFNNMIELLVMKISSDAESLSKVSVQKNSMNGKSGQNKNAKNKLCIMNRQDFF